MAGLDVALRAVEAAGAHGRSTEWSCSALWVNVAVCVRVTRPSRLQAQGITVSCVRQALVHFVCCLIYSLHTCLSIGVCTRTGSLCGCWKQHLTSAPAALFCWVCWSKQNKTVWFSRVEGLDAKEILQPLGAERHSGGKEVPGWC